MATQLYKQSCANSSRLVMSEQVRFMEAVTASVQDIMKREKKVLQSTPGNIVTNLEYSLERGVVDIVYTIDSSAHVPDDVVKAVREMIADVFSQRQFIIVTSMPDDGQMCALWYEQVSE